LEGGGGLPLPSLPLGEFIVVEIFKRPNYTALFKATWRQTGKDTTSVGARELGILKASQLSRPFQAEYGCGVTR
jgi:hypothetical protein